MHYYSCGGSVIVLTLCERSALARGHSTKTLPAEMSFKEVESSYAQLMLQYANERLLFHIKA